MSKPINSWDVYKNLLDSIEAHGNSRYDEEVHCPMVIDVMNDEEQGTIAAFCIQAGISDKTFYRWVAKHPIFNECYRYGCMLSRENWEAQGRENLHNPEFNREIWKVQGSSRYGVGKSNRVRVNIDADENPYEQYKQLMDQASNGDFTSAELKQLMESVNVGSIAFDKFKLQEEVNEMKANIQKMKEYHGDNIVPIESTAQAN